MSKAYLIEVGGVSSPATTVGIAATPKKAFKILAEYLWEESSPRSEYSRDLDEDIDKYMKSYQDWTQSYRGAVLSKLKLLKVSYDEFLNSEPIFGSRHFGIDGYLVQEFDFFE